MVVVVRGVAGQAGRKSTSVARLRYKQSLSLGVGWECVYGLPIFTMPRQHFAIEYTKPTELTPVVISPSTPLYPAAPTLTTDTRSA